MRVSALGKKGAITELMKGLGKMSPEDRKTEGAALNVMKDDIRWNFIGGGQLGALVEDEPICEERRAAARGARAAGRAAAAAGRPVHGASLVGWRGEMHAVATSAASR